VWETLSALSNEAHELQWETLSDEVEGKKEEAKGGAGAVAVDGHLTVDEAHELQWWVKYPGVERVCEIGFNAGHSAAAILLAREEVSLRSFDLGQYQHVRRAGETIGALFPRRFSLVLGDSVTTFAARQEAGTALITCDMTRIDGGHLGQVPREDFANARAHAAGPRVVWMDDVGCSNWNCHEPTRVWRDAVQRGHVQQRSCRVLDASHGFCVGILT
jgi:hypothetical protein